MACVEQNCMDCHDAETAKGDFVMEALTPDHISGRVAYASILERLRAGDMPPAKKPRPDAAEAAAVLKWIQAKLDTPLPGPPEY